MKQSVIGIVYNEKKDAVLLIKRRDVPVWVLPGGGVDDQEKLEDAVIREVLEETGITTTMHRHVATYTPINRLSHLTHTYECKVQSGTPTIGDETQEIAFFSLADLPKTFFFVHKDWLDDAMQNSGNTIYKPLTQVNYWNLFKYFLIHPYLVLRFACSRFGMPINS